jgi:prepilin signal peptidase PulO-like enzyme (type II secretory pathway)
LIVVLLRSWASPPAAIRSPVAFGPFLALGLWLTWLYGPIEMSEF